MDIIEDISVEEYNNRIVRRGREIGAKIRNRLSGMVSDGNGDLLKSFKTRNKYYYGEIDKISYRFLQHGVFVHKGVGRGYKMINGSVTKVSSSITGSRTPKDWFNPVLESEIPKMADLIAEMRADEAVLAANVIGSKSKVIIN